MEIYNRGVIYLKLPKENTYSYLEENSLYFWRMFLTNPNSEVGDE
jgi:hypothetical protein